MLVIIKPISLEIANLSHTTTLSVLYSSELLSSPFPANLNGNLLPFMDHNVYKSEVLRKGVNVYQNHPLLCCHIKELLLKVAHVVVAITQKKHQKGVK